MLPKKGHQRRKENREKLLAFIQKRRQVNLESRLQSRPARRFISTEVFLRPRKSPSSNPGPSRLLRANRRKERKEKFLSLLLHRKEERERLLSLAIQHRQAEKEKRFQRRQAAHLEKIKQTEALRQARKKAEEEKRLQRQQLQKQKQAAREEKKKVVSVRKVTPALEKPDWRAVNKEKLLVRLTGLKQEQSRRHQQQLLLRESRKAEKEALRQKEQQRRQAAHLEKIKQTEALRQARKKAEEEKRLQRQQLQKQKQAAREEKKKVVSVRKVTPALEKPDWRAVNKEKLFQLLKQTREEHERAVASLKQAKEALQQVKPQPKPPEKPPVSLKPSARQFKTLEAKTRRQLRKNQLIQLLQIAKEKNKLRAPVLPPAQPPEVATTLAPARPAVAIPNVIRKQIASLTRLSKNQEKLAREKTVSAEKILASVAPVPVRKPPEIPPAKPVPVTAIPAKKEVSPDLRKQISELIKVANAQQQLAGQQLGKAIRVWPSLQSILKKKVPERAPKLPSVPAGKVPVRYKKPVPLGTLLRRNAFRFVFLLLLFIWIGEIIFFTMRSKSADELFQEITGAAREETAPRPEAPPSPEKIQADITFKTARVDIEGRRDPFSTGVLKMEVIRRPAPTQIALARPPQVISILKTPRIAVVTPGEEKLPEVPRQPPVKEITPPPKPQQPAKPQVPEISGVRVTTERLAPSPEVTAPVISPLIIPERKCTLTYRGKMLMEGMEYFFLEGEKRTYRATLGEEVEGYRLIKKEQDKLYLSKDGHIYEIGLK